MWKHIPIIFPVSQSELTHARYKVEILKTLANQIVIIHLVNITYPVWEHIPYSDFRVRFYGIRIDFHLVK